MPEDDVAAAAVEYSDDERRARRRRLTLLLIPIVFFGIAGTIINISAPALINDHPLVVIFFQPINRYLLAAANQVEPWEFFVVAFVRLVMMDPLWFLLGHWYGEGALNWIEEKTGNSGVVPFLKKWFGRAGPVIVAVAPNAYVCLLAGASGMKVRLFITLNLAGTVVRLVLIRQTADLLEPVIDPVLRFVKEYQWPLVGLSVAIFVLQQAANKRKGKAGDLRSVGSMEREIEASIDAAEND